MFNKISSWMKYVDKIGINYLDKHYDQQREGHLGMQK